MCVPHERDHDENGPHANGHDYDRVHDHGAHAPKSTELEAHLQLDLALPWALSNIFLNSTALLTSCFYTPLNTNFYSKSLQPVAKFAILNLLLTLRPEILQVDKR